MCNILLLWQSIWNFYCKDQYVQLILECTKNSNKSMLPKIVPFSIQLHFLKLKVCIDICRRKDIVVVVVVVVQVKIVADFCECGIFNFGCIFFGIGGGSAWRWLIESRNVVIGRDDLEAIELN